MMPRLVMTPQTMRWMRRLAWVGLVILVVCGAAQVPYVNWRRIVSPLESVPLLVRVDAKGSGQFQAPRSGGRRHRGIDLEAPVGTPVKAIRSGTVQTVAWHRGLGRYMTVRHDASLTSLYAHLDMTRVHEGDRVRQGQVIGTVGKTGNARSALIKPHLHLELAQEETLIDPETWGLVATLSPEAVDDHEAEGGD